MAEFITEFGATLHPEIRKALVVNPTIQHSAKLAQDAVTEGWWPQVYAPQDLDLVRWKLGRYWNDKGKWANSIEEWGADGAVPNTMWKFISTTEVDCPPSQGVDGCAGANETKSLIKVERNTYYGLFDSHNRPNGEAAWLWIVDSTQNTYYTEQQIRERGSPTFGGVQGVSVFGHPDVGVRGKVFYDHACEFEIPHNKRDIDTAMFGSVRVSYADVKPTYNFYIGSYECTIDDPAVDERILPNMYAFLLVEQQQFGDDVIIKGDPASIDNIFEQNVTLNGIISGTLFASTDKGAAIGGAITTLSDMRNKGEKLGKPSSEGQYFDKFANFYSGFNTASAQNIIYRDKLTNLIVPITDLNLYKDFNDKRFNFPMCVDISFSTDVNTEFAKALKESKLSSTFIESRTFVPKLPEDAVKKIYPNPNEAQNNLFSGSAGWKVPKDAGLILWIGPQSEDHFTGGMRIHIAKSDIRLIEPWTGVNSLYLGDKVEIANVEGLYFVPAENDITQTLMTATSPSTISVTVTNLENTQQLELAKGNIGVKQWIADRITAGWEINIVGYWKNWNLSSTNSIANWGGDVTLLSSFAAGSGKSGRYMRWKAYSSLSRQKELLEDTVMDVVDISSATKTRSQLKQWDLTKWVQELASGGAGWFRTDDVDKTTFMGPYNQEIAAAKSNPSDTQFFRTLMTLIIAGKFTKMIDEKTRTFAEILEGKKAYSETVFYKVEKWALNRRGEYANGEPIQSFYLPNSNEIDVHRYIDTQVKYGKRYGYKIFAYQIVFGNRYRYALNRVPGTQAATATDEPGGTIAAGQAEICVFTSPSVRLIEVPYYTFKGIVMDSPPVWPDVNILPYMKENDKVLFLFQGNVGNYKLNPVIIMREDSVDVEKLREAQKEYLGPIEYKSDDHAKTFQVFRMTKPPKTYQDFSIWKLRDVQTDVFQAPQPQKSATAAGFVDDILPNKKYYYMFRSIDIHNHVSNPSPIYEVEITDDGGAPVLLTQVYSLTKEKEPPQKPTKSLKKYIYITPNPAHLQINAGESDLLTEDGKAERIPGRVLRNGPVLGVTNETIWKKKFKIRIVSKKTGKKIDFKLEFKTEHEVPTDQGSVGGQKIC